MTRKVPKLDTDDAAEEFLSQDLSDLDFSQFKPMHFDFVTDGTVEPAAAVRWAVGSLGHATGSPPTPDPSPQGGGRGRKSNAGD